MNAIGIGLFWCVAQVTLLSAVAAVLYGVLRRFGPALGAFVSLTALLLMSAATISSFSRWPNWMPAIESRFAPVSVASATSSGADGVERQATPIVANPTAPNDKTMLSPAREALGAFWDQLRTARIQAENEAHPWRWSSLLAALVCVAVVFGLARLVAGLWAVRAYRQVSQSISDSALQEMLDVLAAELGCVRRIELRECRALTGAATIGWRHPLILLPPTWRTWDEQDRRTVLAHELAHIHHNDYPTWLIAQVGLALHFYHPLAHWLSGCLRLDQELVADSTAARLAGGQQTYLQSLAQIALQQTEPQVSWAARTFLPTRRTFLRRIEMLRDSKQWLSKPPNSLRWLAMSILFVTGFIVVGLRGPAGLGPQTAFGQQAKPQVNASQLSPSTDAEPFGLSYVPRDTFVLVSIRPAALLKQPAFQSIRKLMQSSESLEKDFGADPNRIQSLQVFVLPILEGARSEPIGFVVRCTDAETTRKLAAHFAPQATKVAYGTYEYYRQGQRSFYYQPDEQTLVFAHDEGVMRRSIVAGANGAKSAKWAESWGDVAKNNAAALVNTAAMRSMLPQPQFDIASAPRTPADVFQSQFGAFAPLWQQCEIAVAGLNIDEGLSLKVVGKSNRAEDAKRVHDTLKSAFTLGQNMLSQARQSAANSRSPEGALLLGTIDIADEFLENVKIEQTDTQVIATIDANTADTAQLVAMVAPAVMSAREAARRSMGMNNLKQIALAFHNHHNTYQRLPPAVIYSENKVPRSWRVELLPFLEASDVYDQYRKDEPWDSEHNKKLLDRMPAVYRDPNDTPNSVNTSYFVITGPGTVFERPQGSSFAHILDGTSNTILAVQAKRSVPWTKPEDIPYEPSQPLPKFGEWSRGLFLAAFCDGSVRVVSDNVDEKVLRAFITSAGGEQTPPLNAQ